MNLTVFVHPNVPDALVGDPERLNKVLNHLSDNAVKFTDPGGTVEVNVDVREENAASVLLHCSVRDTGIGIKPELVEKLYHRFTQIDASSTRKYGGMGLGLALSSRLVEVMGGKIWVESEFGKGSLFHFTARLNKRSGNGDYPVSWDSFRTVGVTKETAVTTASVNSLDRLIVEPLLRELHSELRECNIGARDIVDRLVPLFSGTQHVELFNRLSAAVSRFDFDKGSQLLNRLNKELGISL